MRPLYFTKSLDFKACFQPNSTIYSIYSFVESNFFLTCFNLISKPYYTFAKHVPSKQKITIQDPPGKRLTSSQGGGGLPCTFLVDGFQTLALNTPCPAAIPWPYSRIKTGSFCGYHHHKRIKKTKNRVLLGALLFGCIVSFVEHNLCLGSYKKNPKSKNPSKLLLLVITDVCVLHPSPC